MSYTFRLRFKVSKSINLPFEEHSIGLYSGKVIKISLKAHGKDNLIKDSEQLVLIGSGFDSEEDALKEAELARDRLTTAFLKLRFPASFGDRSPQAFATSHLLDSIEQETGLKVFNDVHGIQVYKSDLDPVFISATANLSLKKSVEESMQILRESFETNPELFEKQRLAFELFSESCFAKYVDSRFMLLMMAIETLIIQEDRQKEEIELIDRLINQVKNSEIQNPDPLMSALRIFKKESIMNAGIRLASKLSNQYLNKTPEEFFRFCYRLRSKLIHGSIPRPTFNDINNVNGDLETFTADLILMFPINK